MAVSVQHIHPVAHLPLVLGVLRRLEVATIIDRLLPPHPAHVLSSGRGVEALVLAILDGDHALYKVGQRLEERGMVALLQPGVTRASLHDYRLGHILDALFAANLNKVFSAIALKALEVYAILTPWLHQDTTTIALYGAYADAPKTPGAPRPAYGHSKDGRDDLKQVLLSLGVSGDGGIPLRLGVRDGNRSDSVETPLAIEECLALGLDGMRGIVADSKAYSRRTLGVCLEHQVNVVTLVPQTCAVRQELEAWGQQQSALPLLVEKPGRTKDEAPRRWHGQSVLRQVEVEYSDGRVVPEALRFVVVHSSQLAQQQTQTYTSGQAKEAKAVAAGRFRRPVLVLGIDGAYVPTRPESARGRRPGQARQRARRAQWCHEWREAKGFRFYLLDGERIVHVLSWHQVQNEQELGAALQQVKDAGVIPEEAVRLCVVCDGAEWIWQHVQALFPHARQVLDYYHCSEYLHKVAKAQYGPSAQALEWVEATLTRLYMGKVGAVLGGLRRMQPTSDEALKAIDNCWVYLQNHRGRTDYGRLRRGGYPLGSGGMESSNKFICHVRLKRSGAWWYEESSNQMLALRCAKYNGTFDQVFTRYQHQKTDS